MATPTGILRAISAATVGVVKEPVEHAMAHEGGKTLAERVGVFIAEKFGSVLPAFGSNPGVILGLGLTSALVAAITQGEYNTNRRNIINLYKDELAAKLGKSSRSLKHRDVRMLAEGDAERGLEGNRTIAQALTKARAERNIGIVTSVAASLATFAVFHMALPIEMGLVAGVAASFLVYTGIKTPLNWVGHKLFKVEKASAHERIIAMEKDHALGHTISRDRVFDVYVSVDKELSTMIRKTHGHSFHRLSVNDQNAIMDSVGKAINLEQVTADINSGKMDPTELAFAVDGQTSGHVPGQKEEPKKFGFFGKIKQFIFGKPKEEIPSPAAVAVEQASEAEHQAAALKDDKTPAATIGHVERLQRERAENSLLLQR